MKTKSAAPVVNDKNGTGVRAGNKGSNYFGPIKRPIAATSTQREAYAETEQLRLGESRLLRLFFETYPTREVCRQDLVEAFRLMNKPINHVTRMVYDAMVAGWLEVKRTGISPYSGRTVQFLGLVKPESDGR